MFEVSRKEGFLKKFSVKLRSEISQTCQSKRLNYNWFSHPAAALSWLPFLFISGLEN